MDSSLKNVYLPVNHFLSELQVNLWRDSNWFNLKSKQLKANALQTTVVYRSVKFYFPDSCLHTVKCFFPQRSCTLSVECLFPRQSCTFL